MKSKVIVLFLLAISVTSCDFMNKLTIFDIKYSEPITINSIVGINLPFDIPTPKITTNSTSTFENNNTNKNLIQTIHLKSLKLTITKPVGEDFSLLKSIKLYLNADGETEELVAWLDSVPSTLSTITLEVSQADLKKFLVKDEISFRANVTTDEVNTRDYEVNIDAVFRVDANILGI